MAKFAKESPNSASQKRTGLQGWLDIELRAWFAGRILLVTEPITEGWGYLAATAKQKGITLAVVDGVIAATALQHDLTIVTRNVKFRDLSADVVNPWDDTIQQFNQLARLRCRAASTVC